MPLVSVTMIEGYDDAAKERLCSALTGAVRQVVPANPDGIVITLNDVSPSAYMRGGQSRAPAPPLPDAAQVVRTFLGHMEARDVKNAKALLAEGFTMIFPGGVSMTTLEELIAWAKPRYRFVQKSYEHFDLASGKTGPTVYCHGTLAGEWTDGTPFDGIRFIDRFETAGGKLTRQEVWNDMGEARNG